MILQGVVSEHGGHMDSEGFKYPQSAEKEKHTVSFGMFRVKRESRVT